MAADPVTPPEDPPADPLPPADLSLPPNPPVYAVKRGAPLRGSAPPRAPFLPAGNVLAKPFLKG